MITSSLTVAAVQLTSGDNPNENLDKVSTLVRRACARGAQLVVLPECYGYLGSDGGVLAHAQSADDGPFVTPLRALARELSVAICAGSIPELCDLPGRIYNTSVFISSTGEVVARYRKIHLFDISASETALRESKTTAPGEHVVTTDHLGWRIGLSICYDLRFPELYRALVQAGARLLLVPAAFTLHTGKDHWWPLLQARAIENQCYVIAAGQFGRHNQTRVSFGKSVIFDPWGACLASASECEGVVVAELSADYQDRVRASLPCLSHRRL